MWRRPGKRVFESLTTLRQAGKRLVALSNSEGTVEALLQETGLAPFFETVIDSWVVGVAKPDPAIFSLALERLGATKAEAVMVGDSMHHDIGGAQAFGMRAALIDPFDRHPEASVPRFSDFAAFVTALL